ncbi:hypothetical protein BUALT_Bualt05G0018300 [Buddleja alternifolia]|uniref:B box-type domain-containing protein n=1 Tax=Buddleja alternifolia TaxID=168488 RepID=A0AAV6XK15_9LAMI|nr:hypothetical protein BUALT_Bualt05G0018300 [Buddleja alternifolia]
MSTKMKTQCDVCHKKVASVFCYTEEKALCSHCDHHVHHNHPDHQHFTISYPAQKQIPICDVCQETKAFIFCLEHRAIMCRNCDNSQHANHTLATKHSRFLLTGAKLCTDDRNVGDNDLNKDSTHEKQGRVNQLENGSGVSSSSSINQENATETAPGAPGQTLPDLSSDDPYGLCKKKGGATFEDTDLGCYLNSLSPKRS